MPRVWTLVIPFLLVPGLSLARGADEYILNYQVPTRGTVVLHEFENKYLEENPPPLAPCESLEIRVAARSGEDLVFKEGVGSLFTVGKDLKRKYVLTVAHLIAYQEAVIGICNGQSYELKAIAANTSIDTAVLEVVKPDARLHFLFSYKKGESPQIFDAEKHAGYQSRWARFVGHNTTNPIPYGLFIDALHSELLIPTKRVVLNKDPLNKKLARPELGSSWIHPKNLQLELMERRVRLYANSHGIDAIYGSLLPGSENFYLLEIFGVKPGMSGSPLFFAKDLDYKIDGARTGHTSYEDKPVMVGIVSKTKINEKKTALVPFKVIYENLDRLLSGHSDTSIYSSNDTLYAKGQVYQNLGSADFKNSADEIKFPERVSRLVEAKTSSSSATSTSFSYQFPSQRPNKKVLEEILKDPKQLPNSKYRVQEKVSGVDWGDGNGDLTSSANSENFVVMRGYGTMYMDRTFSERSGIVNSRGTPYYGIREANGFFTPLKSIYSLLKYTDQDVDTVLKDNGLTDKTEAFKALCASPLWQKYKGNIYLNQEGPLFAPTFSISKDIDSSEKYQVYAYCKNNRIEVSFDTYNLKARLSINETSVTGNIEFHKCSANINTSSNNVWERNISNEIFDGKLEIGESKDSLIKLSLFKIHRRCHTTESRPRSYEDHNRTTWHEDVFLGVVNLWLK